MKPKFKRVKSKTIINGSEKHTSKSRNIRDLQAMVATVVVDVNFGVGVDSWRFIFHFNRHRGGETHKNFIIAFKMLKEKDNFKD